MTRVQIVALGFGGLIACAATQASDARAEAVILTTPQMDFVAAGSAAADTRSAAAAAGPATHTATHTAANAYTNGKVSASYGAGYAAGYALGPGSSVNTYAITAISANDLKKLAQSSNANARVSQAAVLSAALSVK